MKNSFLFTLSICFLSSLFSCQNASNQEDVKSEITANQEKITFNINTDKKKKKTYTGTGKLIPINWADTNFYQPFQFLHKDTITKGGWKIEYLVKDDSTRYKDFYIRLSKGTQSNSREYMRIGGNFIPQYVGETNRFLFFESACASNCMGIAMINKTDLTQDSFYVDVLDYDMELKKLLYLNTDNNVVKNIFSIGLLDMTNGKEKNITFKSKCTAAALINCIDSVQLLKKRAVIFPSSYDGNPSPRPVNVYY